MLSGFVPSRFERFFRDFGHTATLKDVEPLPVQEAEIQRLEPGASRLRHGPVQLTNRLLPFLAPDSRNCAVPVSAVATGRSEGIAWPCRSAQARAQVSSPTAESAFGI